MSFRSSERWPEISRKARIGGTLTRLRRTGEKYELALVKGALQQTYSDVLRNHTMQMAAVLSYYCVPSLFPALIFLSAVVAYLPVPDLFGQALGIMGRFIPPDSMGLVRRVLADVITPNRGTFLSFGILGTLWGASGVMCAISSRESTMASSPDSLMSCMTKRASRCATGRVLRSQKRS